MVQRSRHLRTQFSSIAGLLKPDERRYPWVAVARPATQPITVLGMLVILLSVWGSQKAERKLALKRQQQAA